MAEASGRPSRTARGIVDAKTAAEIAAADAMVSGVGFIASSGTPFAGTMLVKGERGPAEEDGRPVLSGPDGDAVRKALAALGEDPDDIYAIASRPVVDVDAAVASQRTRLLVEAVDPDVVIALDGVAAEDCIEAFGLPGVEFGKPVRVMGRRMLAVDGLEASLTDSTRKRRVWAQLRALER